MCVINFGLLLWIKVFYKVSVVEYFFRVVVLVCILLQIKVLELRLLKGIR